MLMHIHAAQHKTNGKAILHRVTARLIYLRHFFNMHRCINGVNRKMKMDVKSQVDSLAF